MIGEAEKLWVALSLDMKQYSKMTYYGTMEKCCQIYDKPLFLQIVFQSKIVQLLLKDLSVLRFHNPHFEL